MSALLHFGTLKVCEPEGDHGVVYVASRPRTGSLQGLGIETQKACKLML